MLPGMSARLRQPLLLMLGGLALFATLALTSAYTMRRVHSAMQERERLHVLQLANTRLMEALIDVETGMRGYVMTYDERFLAPYDAGLRRYPQALRALETQGGDVPAVRRDVAALRPLVRERLRLAALDVALHRAGPVDNAAMTGLTLQGKVAMDAVRRGSARLDRAIVAESARHEAAAAAAIRQAIAVEIALAAVGSAAILLGLYLLQREQHRRRRAEEALQVANAELELRVAERTVELEDARRQLALFAGQLDRGIEAERRRLSRELHDQLGQVFTALAFAVGQMRGRTNVDDGDFHAIDGLLRDGLATARRIAGELRPPLLDEFGLTAAVEHRAEAFARETGIGVEVELRQAEHLDREQALQLFRITQEALTNVARHADASRAWVLGRLAGRAYELQVEDDGRGLQPTRPGSMGLLSMRERAALAGGRLALDRSPRGGLRVRATLPIGGEAA